MNLKVGGPVLAILLTGGTAAAQVSRSAHNLSVSGPTAGVAVSESRVCIFCHTPHTSNLKVPLWNHALSPVSHYSTYSSTTLTVPSPVDQPSGVSKLCLSCHDGTVALGQTVTEGMIAMEAAGGGKALPVGRAVLGTDLTDDHPVSFRPNPLHPEYQEPPPGDPVRLDEDGRVQCTSCHDPHKEDHDPVNLKFLVKSNQGSAICTTCHRLRSWDSNPSSHQSSTAAYTAAQGAHTGYTTVADNGCESCHRSHAGAAPQRLLKFVEEETCDRCHDGTVAARNLAADFQKPYSHPTYTNTPSVHDPAESPLENTFPLPEVDPGARRHAECPDCHDPHAAFDRPPAPPDLPGSLSGTWGIDTTGALVDPATAEYQVCFKCHGDSDNKPQPFGLPNPPYVPRRIVQFNTRMEFDPQNPSHHAVAGPGPNANVPSLLPPLHPGSIIACTDCHNNDAGPGAGGNGNRGPHGSVFNHLLERNLEVGDGNAGADFSAMYALCFKCHSESSILSDESFPHHRLHVDGASASCMVCHDPHGISAQQGNAIQNSHLINFDTSIVLPNAGGRLEFNDAGLFSGECSLSCHDREHDRESY